MLCVLVTFSIFIRRETVSLKNEKTEKEKEKERKRSWSRETFHSLHIFLKQTLHFVMCNIKDIKYGKQVLKTFQKRRIILT